MNLRLSDFDRHNAQWLIRDVKNPDGSKGNHKYAHLEPNAIAIIDELLQPNVRNRMIYSGYGDDLLIPANTRTVGAYFSRACHVCEIDGLRFHDLRHEAATRLAEDNWSIPQIQTVTLHSSWKSLQRYVNLKKRPNLTSNSMARFFGTFDIKFKKASEFFRENAVELYGFHGFFQNNTNNY